MNPGKLMKMWLNRLMKMARWSIDLHFVICGKMIFDPKVICGNLGLRAEAPLSLLFDFLILIALVI